MRNLVNPGKGLALPGCDKKNYRGKSIFLKDLNMAERNVKFKKTDSCVICQTK